MYMHRVVSCRAVSCRVVSLAAAGVSQTKPTCRIFTLLSPTLYSALSLIDRIDTQKQNSISTKDKTIEMNGSDLAPLAICGMACRLSGGVKTPDELWDFILAKKDGRCRVPASRYNIDAFYSEKKKPSTVSTQYGYFLDESIDPGALDTSCFTMNRSEVERADPQMRLLLEVALETLEDAGVTDWRGRTIGTFIANFAEDWYEMMAKENLPWGINRSAGGSDYLAANRISYEFDLKGPRYAPLC